MEAGSLCQYLDWDSDFFGFRIARITVNRLSQKAVERIMMWCDSSSIDCVYFLADADDEGTVRLAEDNQFRFVDIRVTLEKQLDGIPVVGDRDIEGVMRLCRPDDLPALRAIARVSHRDSRFYYDPSFPASLCDALYETWIEKSCNGYADAVLVAEIEGRPIGYLSCHLLDQTEGQIGLFGVGADSQGQGLGQKLLNGSLCWFAEQGVRQVRVVTQGRNCKAQRLYQRCGFLTRSVQLWYHRWFSLRGSKIGP
jgi:dTDP-4-amino-4,6-dideoxy-D-galactose acyltransferase